MAPTASAQTGAILPGAVDLPVQGGSQLTERCPAPNVPILPISNCVSFPRSNAIQMQTDYIQALQVLGWRGAGIEGNSVQFERPIAGGDCSQRLTLTGLPDATPERYQAWQRGAARMGDFESLLFRIDLYRDPICGAARVVQ
jgi:hypothetical protein